MVDLPYLCNVYFVLIKRFCYSEIIEMHMKWWIDIDLWKNMCWTACACEWVHARSTVVVCDPSRGLPWRLQVLSTWSWDEQFYVLTSPRAPGGMRMVCQPREAQREQVQRETQLPRKMRDPDQGHQHQQP